MKPNKDNKSSINKKSIIRKKRNSWFSFSITRILGKVSRKLTEKPLIKKTLYTLLMILTFRIAASITMPGMSVASNFAKDSSSFLGIMDIMGGGTLRNFSIVALGISPFITASILMTMLQSEICPPLHRMSKSGPAGKRKLNIITRCLTLFFAAVQGFALVQQLSGGGGLLQLHQDLDKPVYKYFVLLLILIAGSMFTIFLGEQITSNGVGNGTSLIIFSGIASSLPGKFKLAYKEIVGNAGPSVFIGIMNFAVYCGLFLFLIFIISYIYKSERHVPIQQTGSGMTTDRKQMSRLPIKLNPGGVIPVIFSLMIITLPLTIAQFLHHQNLVKIWIESNLRLTQPLGLSIMILLIFMFSIAMSFVTFNPTQVAENFKKNGTFIPGIRPGDETEKYLSWIIIRLSIFSGFYLSLVTGIQYVEQIIGLSASISFGGTTMIILVTVAIETMSQLKARGTTQKISKQKIKSVSSVNGEKGMEGLLW